MKSILNRLIKFVPAMAIVFSGVQAQALFVEPILGYGLGSQENGVNTGSTKEVYMGGRLGQGILPFIWVAADVGIGTGGKLKVAGAETDYSHQLIGVSAGVDLPIPIIDRGWVGYNFIDNYTIDETAERKEKGSSLKLGVGFKFIPFIAINVEYIIFTSSKSEVSGVETDSSFKNNTVLLSVSLPLP